MEKYIQLNAKLYALLLRYNAYRKVANEYYQSNLIVPISIIQALNKMKIQIGKLQTEMAFIEDRYCELLPFALIEKLIATGNTINIK